MRYGLFVYCIAASTLISTLSLHDALPISRRALLLQPRAPQRVGRRRAGPRPRADRLPEDEARRVADPRDRKSTRLNSSHTVISYAVFCLKKKKVYTYTLHMLEICSQLYRA